MSTRDDHPSEPSADVTARRLAELSQYAMEIAMGNFEVEIPIPETEDAFTEVTTALELMRQDIAHYIKALEARSEQDKIIAVQEAMIRELRIPVVRVWDEVLVLPLVGPVDRARATQMLETLLESVEEAKARVVLVDVTGLTGVGVEFAEHLAKAAESVRLLGAELVLTGLGPEHARTLGRLRFPLETLTSRATLQGGLALALSMTERQIVTDPAHEPSP